MNLPTGKLYGGKQAFTVQSNGQLPSAAAYRPLLAAWRHGLPARLEELGRVVAGGEAGKVRAWFNGVPAMIWAVQRQPGANTVEYVNDIKKLLPVFRRGVRRSGVDSRVGRRWFASRPSRSRSSQPPPGQPRHAGV